MADSPTRTRMPGCTDPDCHEDREAKMAPLTDGSCCDPCIAAIVRSLNHAGVETIASCCGHGFLVGWIALKDGRHVLITRDRAEHRRLEGMIAEADINGSPVPGEAELIAAKDAEIAYLWRRIAEAQKDGG